MSAYHGAGLNRADAGAPPPKEAVHWHATPRWHWRYWLGYRMRRSLWRQPEYIGMIARSFKHEYRTYRQHARWVLEKQHGGEENTSEQTKQSDANWIVSPPSNLGLVSGQPRRTQQPAR